MGLEGNRATTKHEVHSTHSKTIGEAPWVSDASLGFGVDIRWAVHIVVCEDTGWRLVGSIVDDVRHGMVTVKDSGVATALLSPSAHSL
jgi:hypothetical protein